MRSLPLAFLSIHSRGLHPVNHRMPATPPLSPRLDRENRLALSIQTPTPTFSNSETIYHTNRDQRNKLSPSSATPHIWGESMPERMGVRFEAKTVDLVNDILRILRIL